MNEIAARILQSSKYRTLVPDLVERVVAEKAGRSRKETEESARRELHRVYGAYLRPRPTWDRWLAQLRTDLPRVGAREALREVLSGHNSTHERLPELERIACELWPRVGPVTTILDAACGLHPLTQPWWGLSDVHLHAFDVDTAQMAFIDAALTELGVPGKRFAADLLARPALPKADVAMLLKTFACFLTLPEPWRILESLPAPVLVVSFPTASLGGRRWGTGYEETFRRMAAGRDWEIEGFSVPGEMFFVVRRPQ